MINRRSFIALGAAAGLTACAPPTPRLGPDGQPLPLIHRIGPGDAARVRTRLLDQVNALRVDAGARPLTLDPALIAAATSHAGHMARQNSASHLGADGSSPADRAARAGYRTTVLGENTAETYASDAETVHDWMQHEDTRETILDPAARDLGVAFFQDDDGKFWWVLMTGDSVPRATG